jgi:hypothetical protein
MQKFGVGRSMFGVRRFLDRENSLDRRISSCERTACRGRFDR